MSSEALEPIRLAVTYHGRYVTEVEAHALLAEVARLEQELSLFDRLREAAADEPGETPK